MKFKAGNIVTLVEPFNEYDLRVHKGDTAEVLHVSESGDTLRLYFLKWDTERVPMRARQREKIAKHGRPYYVFRSHRFVHDCMFNEGGDAYKHKQYDYE